MDKKSLGPWCVPSMANLPPSRCWCGSLQGVSSDRAALECLRGHKSSWGGSNLLIVQAQAVVGRKS